MRLRQDRSILDSVTERVRQLQRQLGAADNTKVSDYLESLRDVERRILKAEEQSARELPEVERPGRHSRTRSTSTCGCSTTSRCSPSSAI